ncbi:MAG: hypothetical protein EA368_05840 [Leptolyngbya sp. DLM2.Bin27]|nr:MAG: hypothetical protein EA368_05840 [Leptolyngbya sp. DLM2.Bin27]
MGYWEFLLQREGDQSWLPLDTAHVEILEGRYRVMVHTSQINTPVRIQISQGRRDGEAAKRRTLRRQGQINANGLMVVMPFTRLGEGTWDILCASEATDATGASAPTWRYAVQLIVVAQAAADDDDWFTDDDGASLGGGGAGRSATSPGADRLQAAAAAGVDLPAAAAAMDQFRAQLASGLAGDSSPYGLTLPNTALLGSEGESLELTTTVTSNLAASGSPADGPPLALVVRLSDPQTAAAVALASVPLVTSTLPATVKLSVTAPVGLSTRLLLGEVGLLAATEVVALQRFTVTVDVAALFDAIANQAETQTDLGVVFPADDGVGDGAPLTPAADLKPWDLAGRGAPPREMPTLMLPRSSPELPPRIYYPSPHEAAAHQLSLPSVGRAKPAAATGSPSAADRSSRPPGPASEPARGLSLPPVASPPQADDPVAVLMGQVPANVGRKPSGAEPQLISHEAMGFKDLNLQDRFWNRLNDLAVSLQQAARENRAEAAGAAPSADLPSAASEAAAEPVFMPFAGEVVIYADEDPSLRSLNSAPVEPCPEAESPPEAVTPPMPSLELPEGDLTAGETVEAILRVPFHPNRLYLKAWITDPQTRTLADEPRQLMNLLPNGQGQLEGKLQLTVPQGCLEAWFEAIAIDMVTQQESYKASVSRAITPAGLSSLSLDEFQL